MSELVSNDKVKVRYFHTTERFIDDIGTFNDVVVFNHVYKDIYPRELQLKDEHSGTHVTFLNLDITVKDDGVFIYKLFDKRNAFPFFIVRIPYIDSNISKLIFYYGLVTEFLRIARTSLLYRDFHKNTSETLNKMKVKGAQSLRCKKALSKVIRRREKAFAYLGGTLMKYFLNFIFKLES